MQTQRPTGPSEGGDDGEKASGVREHKTVTRRLTWKTAAAGWKTAGKTEDETVGKMSGERRCEEKGGKEGDEAERESEREKGGEERRETKGSGEALISPAAGPPRDVFVTRSTHRPFLPSHLDPLSADR